MIRNHHAIRWLSIIGVFVSSLLAATEDLAADQQEASSVTAAEDNADDAAADSAATGPEEQAPEETEIFDDDEREALADPNLAIKKDRADEYFKRGTLLYEGGDYASAAQAFLVAFETLPHQAVLGNIALCFDKAGKIPEAVTYYRRYLEKPVGSDKNDYMKSRLKELEALVGELIISCLEPDCEVRVDGITRPAGAGGIVLMPGAHRVEALVDGQIIASELIDVVAREQQTVTLDSEESTVTAAPMPVAPPPPPFVLVEAPRLSAGFWAALGTTGVAGVLIGVFGGLTLSTNLELGRLQDQGGSVAEQTALKDEGERLKLVTNIMIGVTGAAALSAVLIAVKDLRKGGKRKLVPVTSGSVPSGVGVAISF